MASPSHSSTLERQQELARKQKKGAPFKFLVPLIYAPILPLIRLTLRHRPVLPDRLFTAVLAGAFAHGFYLVPVLRDRLFTAVLAGAFAHGFYLVSDIYDAESK